MSALAPALAVAALFAAPAQGQTDAPPGELLVRFAPSADAADRAALRERARVELDSTLPVRGLQLVNVDPGQSRAGAERALERADDVVYAEPNFYRRAFLSPDDTSFASQWGLRNTGQTNGVVGADINALAAWDITTGSSNTVVAVVDSGVFLNHPDLAGSSWANPGESGSGRNSNGLDDDRNGFVDDVRGWDWVGDDPEPNDDIGHGTHVAGTIGARTNNHLGVAGASWGTRLMALRAINASGSGTVADVVSAYGYAAGKGVRIVNLSLGSESFSQTEQTVMASLPSVLFVVAAGNGGPDGIGDSNDGPAPDYPCTYPLANIVCVAATNRRDVLSSFSNFGAASVDLAAPGETILSTWIGGSYEFKSGTSMAAPHVAGAAALLLAAEPMLSAAEMRHALLSGVDKVASLNGRVATGGRLDARRSLEIAAPGTIPDPAPPRTTAQPPLPALPPASSPVPVPAAGPRPLRISLRVKDRQPLRRVLARGLLARVTCTKRCSARLKLSLGPREARKARLTRSRRSVSVGTVSLRGTFSRRATVRLNRRARIRLARLGTTALTLYIRGTDAAGDSVVVRRRIILTR